MDQNNTATPDELQQAINSITNAGAATGGDPVAEVEQSVAAASDTSGIDLGTPPVPEIPGMDMSQPAPASVMPGAPIAPDPAVAEPSLSNDSDLGRVKTMALSDIRPLIEKIDMEPKKKFAIYKDIIETTKDKACIEPAYNAAKAFEDEKERAEALLFIIDTIDNM